LRVFALSDNFTTTFQAAAAVPSIGLAADATSFYFPSYDTDMMTIWRQAKP
jgi:hypothetical protein